MKMNVEQEVKLVREAALRISSASTEAKNKSLERIALNIDKNREKILIANSKDVEEAKRKNLKKALIKRLEIDNKKIDEMIEGIKSVISLEDPVRKTFAITELDDGLELYKVSTPIGVISVIFESRPDALVQISTLCIKSGNSVILKGGSEAKNSNRTLFEIIKGALEEDEIFKDVIQLVEERENVKELLKFDEYIDLVVPRGSYELVKYVRENTKIAVLGHSEGICHVYVDKHADIKKAVDICVDAKCQYPAVCNAMETLLVHSDIAKQILPVIKNELEKRGVELKGDERVREIIKCLEATEEDWMKEYNDLILSISIVDSVEEAIHHINKYGSNHTDAIVTEDKNNADVFLEKVDSSSVMWNCSTRFSDGFRYGLGAEVGIATGKIHARGPVGLEGLTTYKYKLIGKGHKVEDYVEGRKEFKFLKKQFPVCELPPK